MSLTPPSDQVQGLSDTPIDESVTAELVDGDDTAFALMQTDESEEKEEEGNRERRGNEEQEATTSAAVVATPSHMAGWDSSASNAFPGAGEMERRAEEKLLDVRIREKYQREIGDIFDESN